jgi:site-specific DNA-methyltransferase (adenine-specific)
MQDSDDSQGFLFSASDGSWALPGLGGSSTDSGSPNRMIRSSETSRAKPKKQSPSPSRRQKEKLGGEPKLFTHERGKDDALSFLLSQGDAVTWLRGLESESVDVLITDPPYESLEKHRAIGTTTRLKNSKASSNAWFEIFPNERFPELFAEVYRVLRRNSHFYLFCDQETMFVAKPLAEKAGFRFWKPIVWDKQKIGMGYHYRSRYEFVLFFEKGKRKLNDLSIPDVLGFPRIFKGYPTEKPAELARVLIEQSSSPGAVVADPFMGSASTGAAALASGRHFLGNDLCDEALSVARKRLGLVLDPASELQATGPRSR